MVTSEGVYSCYTPTSCTKSTKISILPSQGVKKVLLFLVLFLTLGSCVIKIPLHSFEKEVPKAKPNYSNINYWDVD